MKFIKKRLILILNIIVVILLLTLPYILFQGKLYISGDDTRLYYYYPYEYLIEFTYSSWHHFSSVGTNGPTQFMMPFLLVWTFLSMFIPRIMLGYLGFSLPFILGFIFLQLFINELFPTKKIRMEAFLGSLFFITSPILQYDQYFIFLSTVWLLPLIPAVAFFYLRYISSGQFKYVTLSIFICLIFSIGIFSIPWILGCILPIGFVAVFVFLTIGLKDKLKIFKKSIFFASIIITTQVFWLLPFVMTYFQKGGVSFGSKIFTKGVSDTFSPTVLATATGNIIYPLLNLIQRQITLDFNWQLKNIFLGYYDKTFFIDSIFVFLLFLGIFLSKKYLSVNEKNIFLVFLISFIILLFLFTVNIGPFKGLFLILGKIPGFVMFRNFYDKFSLGYLYSYAVLISFSFVLIKRFSKFLFVILSLCFIFVVSINFIQVGPTVNAPLWQTKDIKRNISIPEEYISFMKKIKKTVPSTNNIFTIPFGTALYSVIKDTNSDSVYTGTSPVKLFSGVNDLSGFLSFYFSEANSIIERMIVNRDYDGLSNMLDIYNVNYAFVNSNIPKEVLNSWVFDKRMTASLDLSYQKKYLESTPIIVSTNGNYKLYSFKRTNTLFEAKNLTYKKINETKFIIYIHGLKNSEKLIFHDSYHNGWNLYPVEFPSDDWCNNRLVKNMITECNGGGSLFEGDELMYLFRKPIFSASHKPFTNYFVNSWLIDEKTVTGLGSNYFHRNEDGTIDIEMVMYFLPQDYFYVGIIISVLAMSFVIVRQVSDIRRRKRK